nr:MAG TPA: hypothetical protein [Caudoviricetes sp.]
MFFCYGINSLIYGIYNAVNQYFICIFVAKFKSW